MLKHAVAFLEPATIDLKIGSADWLPYPNRSFDVVYVSLVLMHVPGNGVSESIREAVRVARKGIVVLDEYRQLPEGVYTENINEYTFAHNHRAYFAAEGLKVQTFEIMEKWVVLSVVIDRKQEGEGVVNVEK
jgi:ubiquinone/menaquinone biosynthesis C-methylase UbiE